MRMRLFLCALVLPLVIFGNSHAQKKLPPPGINIPEKDRAELSAGVANLGKEIAALRQELLGKPALLELLPDVQIFHDAVRYALTYNEFYSPKELVVARDFLKQGHERAAALRAVKAPWTTSTGLVVRGYVSKIDGSVQPYGLVVPVSYNPQANKKHRLDFWYHGRGETLTELSFLKQRQTSPGQFTPKDTFVVHPYGRYCNANHLAGEVDTFEVLEHVRKHYPIDDNRLIIRGFSMGGAACWHLAVHHAGHWVAAAPGAGFAETPVYTGALKPGKTPPPWYEQTLWHVYDCPDYVKNLYHCPVVAYSGEVDKQKQAADIMEAAMKKAGLDMVHIIGPKMGHKYHPESIKEINKHIDALAAQGRNPVPKEVHFTTWTLRYNRMLWVQVDGLQEHWKQAKVRAKIVNDHTIEVKTANVSALTLTMPADLCPLNKDRNPSVILDGNEVSAPLVPGTGNWVAQFHRTAKGWESGPLSDDTLHKSHGLQGPIDDAFLDSFVMVLPTAKSPNNKVSAWIAAEQKRAREQWRALFRGEAPVINATDLTDADIRDKNLILWGDPQSNPAIARIIDRLPIQWTATKLVMNGTAHDAGSHVPVLIYPNPLNPKKYIVLNSGFTFREGHYQTNSNMIPKLPDWVVFDITQPATPTQAAGIEDAGFFGERWQFQARK